MATRDEDAKGRWFVILPAYNEEENLGLVVDDVLDSFEGFGVPCDVLVVDDGSSDRTPAIADEYAARHPQVRVIHHETNLGFGGALSTGYAQASGDRVVVIPSDRQFQCRDLERCLPLVGEDTVVVCVRRGRRDPFARRLASDVYRGFVRLLFGLGLDDINWVKIYPLSLIRQIRIESKGPFIDTELLIKCSHLGARIRQVDVPHYPRVAGQATGAGLRAVAKTFVDLFRLHRRLARVERAAP